MLEKIDLGSQMQDWKRFTNAAKAAINFDDANSVVYSLHAT